MSEMLLFSPLAIRRLELRNRIVVQILREGHADLIAVGREILNNPKLKLGIEGPFRNVPPAIRVLAGDPRQAWFRHSTVHVAKRPQRYRKGVVKLSAGLSCGEKLAPAAAREHTARRFANAQ